jgi:hypothetical protein
LNKSFWLLSWLKNLTKQSSQHHNLVTNSLEWLLWVDVQ